jgi:O-antigen/teichoic acid export membrane protein
MAGDRFWMLRWAAYSQGAQFVVNFAASIAVARLLGPEEMGAYSVGLAAIVVAQVLRLAGLNSFLIQERELTRSKVASAFGLACAFSFVLGVIVIAVRGPIADFYASPATANVLLIAGLGYFVSPLLILANGVRTRQLEVRRIAASAILGAIVNAGVSILLAALGHGAASLAWGDLAGAIVATLVLWWRAADLMWTLPRFGGWWHIWRISSWSMGSSLLDQLGGRSGELVIGRTLGVGEAGLFSRAESLPRMMWNYVAPPTLHLLAPMMANDMREGHDIRDLTTTRMRLFACLFGPALVAMATQSQPLILFLYGAQWAGAIVPAFWLCLSSALIGQFVIINSALLALGRTRELFLLNAAEQGARVLTVLLLGQTNLDWIARGLMLWALTYVVSASWVGFRLRIIEPASLARALRPGLVCCLTVFAAGEAALRFADRLDLSHVMALLLAAFMTFAAWLATLLFVEKDVLRVLSKALIGREFPAPRA